MYSFETELQNKGVTRIAGVDEAGRGPLAGPVVAAAVILPSESIIDGLNDSKKLTEKKRDALYELVLAQADVGVGIVDEETIDSLNIYQASRLAMKKAVLDLSSEPEHVLIDGNMRIELPLPSTSIIKGDSRSASIAAASIIAKVTRDAIMVELHQRYPQYAFDKHKGYPTKLHIELLETHGITPIHRQSFGPV
ncbi:MAG: ribonuclease HII, partial [Bacteroides sp.]|nr:ribonuclease HII [Bacteroides sp.]